MSIVTKDITRFKESELWILMENVLRGRVESARDELEMSADHDSSNIARGKLIEARALISFPEMIVDYLEQQIEKETPEEEIKNE